MEAARLLRVLCAGKKEDGAKGVGRPLSVKNEIVFKPLQQDVFAQASASWPGPGGLCLCTSLHDCLGPPGQAAQAVQARLGCTTAWARLATALMARPASLARPRSQATLLHG